MQVADCADPAGDIQPESARKFGIAHFINPKNAQNVVDAIVQLTDGCAACSFERLGNTQQGL